MAGLCLIKMLEKVNVNFRKRHRHRVLSERRNFGNTIFKNHLISKCYHLWKNLGFKMFNIFYFILKRAKSATLYLVLTILNSCLPFENGSVASIRVLYILSANTYRRKRLAQLSEMIQWRRQSYRGGSFLSQSRVSKSDTSRRVLPLFTLTESKLEFARYYC